MFDIYFREVNFCHLPTVQPKNEFFCGLRILTVCLKCFVFDVCRLYFVKKNDPPVCTT